MRKLNNSTTTPFAGLFLTVVEDVIQYFGSNVECFEYLSHVHQKF